MNIFSWFKDALKGDTESVQIKAFQFDGRGRQADERGCTGRERPCGSAESKVGGLHNVTSISVDDFKRALAVLDLL